MAAQTNERAGKQATRKFLSRSFNHKGGGDICATARLEWRAVWLDYIFNILLFTAKKICPIAKIFHKLGSKVCQSLNEPLKVYQHS